MQRARNGRVFAGFIAALIFLPPVSMRAADTKPSVHIEAGKDGIEFRHGAKLVGRYVIGPEVAKPYFWPLNTPGGQPITRGWPMAAAAPEDEKDHVHQKSAWFCHGDVIPEGIALKQKIKGVTGVDFWSETAGHGRIVCTKVGEVVQKNGHGRVTTFNEWRTADRQKVLDETRIIHLHDLGGSYLIVLDIDLHASVAPITFGDTKEGSMGVRVRGSITEKKGKGKITNADGKQGEKAAWGQQSAWCGYSGPVGEDAAGITLFVSPANHYRTCWHVRGYGLMAANPFGRGASGFPGAKGTTDLVKLAKGEHLKLRYGIFLHTGDVKEGNTAEAYERFTKLKE